jgi:hypothetical protein
MLDMVAYPFPDLLPGDTGANSSIAFLSNKYDECCTHHTLCQISQSDAQFYPTRLMHVGAQKDGKVHLRDMHRYSGQDPYFTLSHCWGKKLPLTLTKETASALKAGTPVKNLPKTFQEAVLVTRSFRVRYLWYVISRVCMSRVLQIGHRLHLNQEAAAYVAETPMR